MNEAIESRRVRDLVEQCLAGRLYVNYIAYLFGWKEAENEGRVQKEELEFLVGLQATLDDTEQSAALEDSGSLSDLVARLNEDLAKADASRDWWRQNPVPVICDDETLKSLAIRVRNGPPVILSKAEIESHFDMSHAVRFWDWMPTYTKVWFAFGLHWSLPDANVFESMAYFHDETLMESQHTQSVLGDMGNSQDRRSDLFASLPRKKMFACQTLINACLCVESFINGLASVARTKLASELSDDELLFLSEQRMKNGMLKQRFVSTQDKLVDWVKLMSPQTPKVGLEKGKSPLQDFREIQRLRDSIVHLSDTKADEYDSIGEDDASRAVDVTISVIREICTCIASDPKHVAYPPWLKDRGSHGFFDSKRKRVGRPNSSPDPVPL